MSKELSKLTIFTPTYNRENLLPKLYDSLLNQTNKNFVWLIVDDGSTDNTEEVVNKWINEKKIVIEYHKKKNGGKNTAIDFAHQHCETKYIGCVDSDDYLTNDAVDVLYNHFEKTDKNEKCIGLVGRRCKNNGEPFNSNWCTENLFLKFKELSTKYHYNEDTFLIFKTELIKKYIFPKIEGEKFITESVLYNQFMFDFDLYAFNELIYVAEYMEDGYTKQGLSLFFKNPEGYLYSLKQNLFYAVKYGNTIKTKIGLSARYYAWKKVTNIKDNFKNDYKIPGFYKIVGKLFSPIMTIRYKKKYKN